MTTQDLTFHTVALPGRLMAGVAALFRNRAQRRRILRLRDLDDHILDDIGLTRDDVSTAARLPLGHNPAEELVRLAREHRRDRDALLRSRFRL